jgi:hypothetical protein
VVIQPPGGRALLPEGSGEAIAWFHGAPGGSSAPASLATLLTQGLAALMTVLRDFIDEIGSELDARADKSLAPLHWIRFAKLLDDIDKDDQMGDLRRQVEQIVAQRDVRFQDRCLALIPLLSADPAIAAAFTRRRRAALTALAAL